MNDNQTRNLLFSSDVVKLVYLLQVNRPNSKHLQWHKLHENINSGLLFGESLFDVLHAYKLRENAGVEEEDTATGIKMKMDYSWR